MSSGDQLYHSQYHVTEIEPRSEHKRNQHGKRKGKATTQNSRALVKELGVTELDLTTTPENVIVHTKQTLDFALKLSSEYVKFGLGMMGGGD